MRQDSKLIRATLRLIAGASLIAAGAAAAGGCKSSAAQPRAHAEDTADSMEQNRLLTRLALAENVYNGAVAESALYPKDFVAGSTQLNALGRERMRMLVNAYRNGVGRITVLRGAEEQELYAARVAAVRQQLADAGPELEKVAAVAGDHVAPAGSSSGRAVLGFTRMMADAAKPAGGGGTSGASAGSFGSSGGNQAGK
jgi:hypothetical protein